MLKKLTKTIREDFFDIKFRDFKANYILQCCIIFLCITGVLLLYGLFGGIIVGSVGATSFILFVTPHVNLSRARYIIGSYCVAGVTGNLFGLVYDNAAFTGFSRGEVDFALIVLCAAAVAVTAFILVIANLEHPPAAALTLGIVAGDDRLLVAAAALLGAVLLCSARAVLRKYLINLI